MTSNISRRSALFAIASVAGGAALAQDFPSRPIRLILAFAPGGVGDLIARLYAQKMSELLGTPVIVENRPGANQMTAIRMVLAAPPDGYTLYFATGSSLVQNPGVRKDLGYDPLKDFSLIGLVDTVPGVIFVDPNLPVHTVKELVAYSAANPGKLNYGSAGLGTAGHLAAELFLGATGAKMSHIPYKADQDVIREVMAGTIQMGIMAAANTVPAITAGKIRGIAVTTPARLPYLPGVPSLSETGINALAELSPHTLHALTGPAGMPAPIIARLADTLNKVSAMPDVTARMRTTLYAEPMNTTPATFRTFVEKELAKWTAVGRTVKIAE